MGHGKLTQNAQHQWVCNSSSLSLGWGWGWRWRWKERNDHIFVWTYSEPLHSVYLRKYSGKNANYWTIKWRCFMIKSNSLCKFLGDLKCCVAEGILKCPGRTLGAIQTVWFHVFRVLKLLLSSELLIKKQDLWFWWVAFEDLILYIISPRHILCYWL